MGERVWGVRVLGLGVLGERDFGAGGFGVRALGLGGFIPPDVGCNPGTSLREALPLHGAGPRRSGGLRARGCGRGRGVWLEGGKGTPCSAPRGALGGSAAGEVSAKRACASPQRCRVHFSKEGCPNRLERLFLNRPRGDLASGRAQAEPAAGTDRLQWLLSPSPPRPAGRPALPHHPCAECSVVSFSLQALGISP